MNKQIKRLAIVGTQGLPNKYGGFETLVEFLAKNLSDQFDITVFCSSKVYRNKQDEIYGSKLVYLPFDANGSESIIYDIVSILKSVKKYDKILVLGASGGIVMPFLKKKYKRKLVLNFGGLDWKRSKWGRFAKVFLKLSEKMAVKNSGTLIADNLGIQDYIKREYSRDSILIEYGGDQVTKEGFPPYDIEKYPFVSNSYAFSVARIQSDNNIDMLLDAFREDIKLPIVAGK
jgi:glycosyltransferase involved in cell wall biosynthesis